MLAAARDLFTTQGYEATSMRQIAERADVSVGTVANTGDKATLLARMFGHDESVAFLGRIARIEAGEPTHSFADDIDDAFHPWYESVEQNPGLVRAFMLDVLLPGAGGDPGRRERDAAVVVAIRNRLLALHPSLDRALADSLAYAAYAAHAVAVIAVAMGDAELDEARARANAAVHALCRDI